MQSITRMADNFLQSGAIDAAMRVRWFETTLEGLTMDEALERWMMFCQCGTFKLQGE